MAEPEDEGDEDSEAPVDENELPPFDEAELDGEFTPIDESEATELITSLRWKNRYRDPFSARLRAADAADYLLRRRHELEGKHTMKPMGGSTPGDFNKKRHYVRRFEKRERIIDAELSHKAMFSAKGRARRVLQGPSQKRRN